MNGPPAWKDIKASKETPASRSGFQKRDSFATSVCYLGYALRKDIRKTSDREAPRNLALEHADRYAMERTGRSEGGEAAEAETR
jgi:hypothetical protein